MPTSKEPRRDPYHGPVHETVLLTPPFPSDLYGRNANNEVEIDVDMAPLMLACWRKGLVTAACCQGRRGLKHWSISKHAPAYILFRSSNPSIKSASSLHHAATFVQVADLAGVGPNRHWTHWGFTFDPRPPYGHSVSFPPAYIEAITAQLLQQGI